MYPLSHVLTHRKYFPIFMFCLLLFGVSAQAGPLEFVRNRLVSDGSPGMITMGDGIPSRGENVELALTLRNTGAAVARVVTARLISVTPSLAEIVTPTASFGQIAAGAEKESVTHARIFIDQNAPDFSELVFDVVLSESGGAQWAGQFKLTVLPSVSVSPAVGNNQNPSYLAFDRTANRLYCTNPQTGSVAVVDPQVNTVVTAFRLGTFPDVSAVDSSGNRLFVLDKNPAAPAVHVVSTLDYSIIQKVALPNVPHWITFHPSENRCYISFDAAGAVQPLDCSDYSLLGSIPLGGKPAASFVDSVSQTLHVVNYGSLSVDNIDLATQQVLDSVDLSKDVSSLWSGRNGVYDADNRTLYLGASQAGGDLCIVRIRNGSIIDVFPFDGEGLTTVEGLAWDPSRSELFVVGTAQAAFSRVVVLFVDLGSITQELNLLVEGLFSSAVHVSTSRKVYIGNSRKYRLDVISSNLEGSMNLSLDAPVWLGNSPVAAVADETRNLIYSVNRETNSVSVIDGNTNLITETFPVGRDPEDAVFVPGLNRLLVALKSEHRLAVVDTLTRNVLSTLYLGNEMGEDKRPHRLCYNSVTDKVYVANSWSGDVSVVTGASLSLVKNIPIDYGTRVYGIAVNEVSNEVYVSDANGRVAVIDGSDDTVSSFIDLAGKSPNELVYDPVGDRVFLTTLGYPMPKEILVVSGKQLTGSIVMPEPILSLLAHGESRRLYATGFSYGKLYVIDLDTLSIISSLDAGWEGLAMALNEFTGRLYVGGHRGGAYSVIPVSEPIAPVAPEILSVLGDSQAVIDWTADGSVRGFNVYRARAAAGPFTKLNYAPLLPDARRFVDPTAVNGNTYFYAVSSLGERGVEGNRTVPPVQFVPQDSTEPDFRLSSLEVAVALQPATSATATLLLQPLGGFDAMVSLSGVSVPDGLELSFSAQNSFLPAAVVVEVTGGWELSPGVFPIVLGASGAGIEKEIYLFVIVREPSVGGMRKLSLTDSSDAFLRQGIQVMLTTDAGSYDQEGFVTLKGRIRGVPTVSSCQVFVSKPDGSVETLDNVMVTDGLFGIAFPIAGDLDYGIWRAVVAWQGGIEGLGQTSQVLEIPVIGSGLASLERAPGSSVAQQDQNQMIIVGGQPGEAAPKDSISELSSRFYYCLLTRRYTEEGVAILSSIEDMEGRDDDSTIENLSGRVAGSIDSGTLALYLVGEIQDGAFVMNADERITAPELNAILATADSKQKQVVIIDAPDAGGFRQELAAGGRAIVLSTHLGGKAHLNEPWRTFTVNFLSQVLSDMTLNEGFNVTNEILKAFSPFLRDQIPVKDFQPESLGALKIGGMFTPAQYPRVQDTFPPIVSDVPAFGVIEPNQSFPISVRVQDESRIAVVRACVNMPDGTMESYGLSWDGTTYSAELGPFSAIGLYPVSIMAEDVEGNVSAPLGTSVLVLAGDLNSDGRIDSWDWFHISAMWHSSDVDYDATGRFDAGDIVLMLESQQFLQGR